jgi:isopenicillin N synthase-like dioxygenase
VIELTAINHIDLGPWFTGDEQDRRQVAARVDEALRDVGFLLATGHGVPGDLRDELRAAARKFFLLPTEVKRRYAISMGERGWLGSGAVTAGYSEGTATPPDLKETFVVGAHERTGNQALDDMWFKPNVYPAEVPDLAGLIGRYLDLMRRLSDAMLVLCANALNMPDDFFLRHATRPTYTLNINWYPALIRVPRPRPNQFRIGPHRDFGTITILDRQDAVGGLQVHTRDDEWVRPPYVPGGLTINIGDLMRYWTGSRWCSSRHRVLPPDPTAPEEEPISLIYFYSANPDAIIEPIAPPIGVANHPPVRTSDFLMERIRLVSQDH